MPELTQKKRYILTILRGLFIFFLFILLFNPIITIRRNIAEKPVFLLLSDKSNSMAQLIDGRSKTEHLALFEREIQRISLRSNYAFERIELFSDNPKQSNLMEAIRGILHSGKDIKGIAIASDGWFHDDPALFRELISIPIYTFDPNISKEEPLITINNINYNKNARINEIQPIRVSLTTNNIEGKVDIILKKNNVILQQRILDIPPYGGTSDNISQTFQIEFDVLLTETGLHVFEIEALFHQETPRISPTDGQEYVSDKRFAAIQVLDTKSKLLILTDMFSWDVRMFNRFLNFNERFDADLFYSHHGAFRQGGNQVEIRWQDYAGFIFINHGNLSISTDDTTIINNMILNGTGLIFVGNIVPNFEAILPTRATNINILGEAQTQLRPEALTFQTFRDIEVLWNRFPPIQFHYLNPKEQTTLLADALDQNRIPVVFLGNHGSGNVLHIAFHGLWRWQMNNESDLLNNFINGLAQSIFSNNTDNFFSFTNKNIFYSGEEIVVHLSAFDERMNPLQNINARLDLFNTNDSFINDDEGNNLIFSDFLIYNNGLFSITLPQIDPGVYKYTIFDDMNNNESFGEFEVLEQDIESINRGFNDRLLFELSQSSGGYQISENDLYDFRLENVESFTRNLLHEIQLYRNVLFITIFLVTFCIELYFRKKWGLL